MSKGVLVAHNKLEANLQDQRGQGGHGAIPLSAGMLLVTLGVVYGDIGTSPMYTMKSIVANNGGIGTVSEDMILGALSLVIWTMTLVTTVKYVVIAMKADNHNEGGIFALFSLVRKVAPWLILPAMIGGAALLADGILTPAVTVTTAIEGLRTIEWGHALLGDGQTNVIIITIIIICGLFAMQRAGTSSIGKLFGPLMTLWFLFLAGAGLFNMLGNLSILRALNPIRGIMFLFSPINHSGIMVLGFVFLSTTGAEALYSDMGHVGKANIYASWPFVKAALILNYLGQGAWLLANNSNPQMLAMDIVNPFYMMLPEPLRPFAIVLSAVAAIIASQALITGSFSLVSEATRLNLMPHLRIHYPSDTKGQLYIPLVNNIMWVGCIFIVLLFQNSERMESAYGLAITVTMLMTTTLLTSYIAGILKHKLGACVFALLFGAIELCFFASCLTMFFDGGYVMIFLASLLFGLMYVWRRGTAIERTQTILLPVSKYIDQLNRLRNDETYPVLADNLVFLTNSPDPLTLDRDVLYSILDKHPKRAKAYWFINVHVTDEPYTHEYSVETFGTDFLFRVRLDLGFKVNQRVNAYLRQIVGDLMASGELPPQHHTYSIYETRGNVGDFRFCMLRKMLAPETDINRNDHRVMAIKYAVRRACGSPARWYGLENSAIIIEYVPLFARMRPAVKLVRTQVPLEVQIEEAEEMEVDIFSDDLVNGNEAGKSMNVDPTELLESVADTPEQQLDGLESTHFNAANDKLYESAWKSQFLSGLMMPIMNFVGNLGYVAVAIVGSIFAANGVITIGDIQAFIQYVKNFTQPIQQLSQVSNMLQSMAAAAERVFEFLNEPEEEQLADPARRADPADIDGQVTFDHVRFGYTPDKTVIHDFSCTVQPGQKVAIVGPTGAGKTTMVKLLMRFYDVDAGSITLNGHNVRDFDRSALREGFGMVLQDTWLFKGTIMENIRYGRLDATDEEVIAAAKAANADHFIRTLPGGYQMELNEDASNVSQGQKQLLTIARTILADNRILILDEATSSVDTRTEQRIQTAMDRLMEGRTSFVIAHRLSTIRDADLILVMRDGDIVEQGTHDQLIEAGGFYADLYNSQFEDVVD